MISLHCSVLLYKQFDQKGFGILSEEFSLLEENLPYVHLKDVSFVVCEPKRYLMHDSLTRTVHAFAHGTLEAALPPNIRVPPSKVKLIESLPEVYYNPYLVKEFYIKGTNTQITEAKEVFAYEGKVKVLL
jgi:hypothetical protein